MELGDGTQISQKDTLAVGNVPQSPVHALLTDRVIDDGFCAIDIHLMRSTMSALASYNDIADAAASIIRLCIKDANPSIGGIAYKVGE